jgi:hypothetical protein
MPADEAKVIWKGSIALVGGTEQLSTEDSHGSVEYCYWWDAWGVKHKVYVLDGQKIDVTESRYPKLLRPDQVRSTQILDQSEEVPSVQ